MNAMWAFLETEQNLLVLSSVAFYYLSSLGLKMSNVRELRVRAGWPERCTKRIGCISSSWHSAMICSLRSRVGAKLSPAASSGQEGCPHIISPVFVTTLHHHVPCHIVVRSGTHIESCFHLVVEKVFRGGGLLSCLATLTSLE